ncbi:MAG TPA: hypothetical protein VN367_04860 [Chlorobaculum sp.]|jgi:hypothetical protein|nr:hypothetical protein [Chlorobaculum sp.]
MRIFRQFSEKIREINTRYAKPKVEMSPLIKFSLTGLRLYLFVLVALLLYKFITLIPAGK